jgi:hypothetical protein
MVRCGEAGRVIGTFAGRAKDAVVGSFTGVGS